MERSPAEDRAEETQRKAVAVFEGEGVLVRDELDVPD